MDCGKKIKDGALCAGCNPDNLESRAYGWSSDKEIKEKYSLFDKREKKLRGWRGRNGE